MTISIAEQLIPRIDSRLIHKETKPLKWRQIRKRQIEAAHDKKVWWQLEKFAPYFKARNPKGQRLLLKDLHGFVFDNFPYKADGFHQQEIKQPAVCFHERHLGVDCKDRARFILDCCRLLGLTSGLMFLGFMPQQIGKVFYVRGHVYVVVYLDGKRIAIDATLPDFGAEFNSRKIIHKDEILCF